MRKNSGIVSDTIIQDNYKTFLFYLFCESILKTVKCFLILVAAFDLLTKHLESFTKYLEQSKCVNESFTGPENFLITFYSIFDRYYDNFFLEVRLVDRSFIIFLNFLTS